MDFSFIYDINYHPIERLIRNNDSSSSISKVKGMVHNVQWFVSPRKDACYGKVAASLYAYLLLQGYDKGKIVLLTLTPGQLEIFRNLPKYYQIDAENVKPFYEFEPGKIVEVYVVLIGNDPIGSNVLEQFSMFLNIVARQVRSGLYLIGNPSSLSPCSKLESFLGCLKKNHRLSSSILLQCPRHKTQELVREYKDFPLTGEGFCSEPCGQELKCGHLCPQLCHFGGHDEQEGSYRRCFQSCGKRCANNHPCSQICHAICPPCNAIMSKTFRCGHKVSYKCSQHEPLTCGHTKRILKGPCGHELTIVCGLEVTPKCTERVTQTLPCGHTRNQQCYQRSQPCLHELSTKRPKCGHFVRYLCSESLEDKLRQPCEEECLKFCKRGHPCQTEHKCGEPCPPCEVQVSFMFGGCHHRMDIPCCQGDWKEAQRCRGSCTRPRSCAHPCTLICGEHRMQKCPPCEIIVETERSCGHKWTHPCWMDESGIKCEELVSAQHLSACDHEIEVKCFEAAELCEGEAIFYCKSRCNRYFDPAQDGCGHLCTATCRECADTSFHRPCTETCLRVLFCGHKCQSRCSSTCPPCQELCEYSCPHGRCNHLCGFPCVPCREPCTYECPHGKCTAECAEECNKLPCEHPCRKRLRCGHNCAGFCGEPCPPLCAICDEKKLLAHDLLGKTSIESTDRFILLVDCGHTFDAEAVKALMNKPFVVGEIRPKSCPICRTEIRTSLRFKSVLMKNREDMNAIKLIIYGEPKMKYSQQLEVHENLRMAVQFDSAHVKLRERLFHALYSASCLAGAGAVSFRQMGLQEAQNLAFIAKIYSRFVALHAELAKGILRPEAAEDLDHYLLRTEDFILNCPWPLTGFEIRSVAEEWHRISDLKELYMKESPCQHEIVKRLLQQRRGKTAFKRAYTIVTAIGAPYDDRRRADYAEALEELEQALESKIGISDPERFEIMKAFNFSTGRWFKCPNGHIYVITECGGATEESVCNECGAKIGGENHSVIPTNDLASEMDGATQPLYPTALDRSPN